MILENTKIATQVVQAKYNERRKLNRYIYCQVVHGNKKNKNNKDKQEQTKI